ncbi:unnamed protein product [Periconia digitata]|uniref:Protein kinase domain-containing protein n=1 Tax=Periconia digitata TaxID=1303443 RepID=A0A9W4U0X3_9PLEO|nr:unnamed protein product [Periconia digitata]
MIDPVGAPLAIFATLVWCYGAGHNLVKKWQMYQQADERIRDHTVQLNDHCIRLDAQSKLLETVWSGLSTRHKTHFEDLAQILKRNLQAATDNLTGAEERKPRRFQRLRKKASSEALRYSFVFEAIEDSVKKLESWHTRFDSAFYLLTRVAGINLDPRLGENDSAPGQPVRRLRLLRKAVGGAASEQNQWLSASAGYSFQSMIPYSSVGSALYGSQQVLVDTLTPDSQAELDRTSKSIHDLGEILKQSDASTFGLLSCLGVFYQAPSSATAHRPKYNMLFTLPAGLRSPVSLRYLLRQKNSDSSMNERLNLAIGLAKSLLFVHNSKFVHKNIRPETVVVFSDNESKLGKCFLMGFEQFRPADGWTRRKGDARLERHVYRHPSRQGLYPETDYMMQHDIYSLGVLLLEIGLWTSFVEYDKDKKPTLLPFIGTKEILADKQEKRRSLALKARLMEATGYLPNRMGRRYTDVVLTCLSCLDDTEENIFGHESEFTDSDGVGVAVRFSETVLEQLQMITI